MRPLSKYEFYIVALTKQGKLVDAYVRAHSFSEAFDKFVDQLDLSGNITEYKFCIRREFKLYPEGLEQ